MSSPDRIAVLLIDDSRLSRTGLRTHFHALCPAWPIDEAASADQALAMAEIKDYGLFVVDINMPGISGLELVPLLRARAPKAKIVVVSANTQDPVRGRVEAMGAGFVGKPIKKETVEQVLGVAGLVPAKAEKALIDLTPSEHDALLEVFNVAIGAAADIMNQMVRDEVTLNVPSFDFVDRDELLRQEGGAASQRVCAVTQRVGGIFDSEAMLLFKEDKALAVVNTILSTETGKANSVTDFADAQEDVLKEIGNIVLSAAVAAIADMFGAEFEIAPPRCQVGALGDILGGGPTTTGMVLLLVINFTLQHQEVQGRIAFMMDMPAMEEFRRRVHALIDTYNG